MKNIVKIGLVGLLLLFMVTTVFAAPIDAGFILNDESDQEFQQITISRANDNMDSESRVLYEGDCISGSTISTLKIQLNPGFQMVSISADTVKVILDRSQSEKNLFSRIVEWFIGDNKFEIAYNSTKGAGISEQIPKPGFYATLLSGQPATFAWQRPAKTLTVFTSSGKMIYQKELNGQTSIDLSPEEIGLRPGSVYTWKVDSSNWNYKVALLDELTSKKVRDDLAAFDTEVGSSQEKQLKKVSYLQLVSDIYGNKADLYWLSYQLAKEVEMTNTEMASTMERFKERVSWHLNRQMSEVQ